MWSEYWHRLNVLADMNMCPHEYKRVTRADHTPFGTYAGCYLPRLAAQKKRLGIPAVAELDIHMWNRQVRAGGSCLQPGEIDQGS